MVRNSLLVVLGLILCHCGQVDSTAQWEDVSSIPLTQSAPFYGATQGALEFAGNGYVTGWAIDTSNLTEPATVEIWIDGEYNGQTKANIVRAGLAFLNCTGAVGFEYFPTSLSHKTEGWDVQAYVIDQPVGNRVLLPCVGDCFLEKDSIPKRDAYGAIEVASPDLISGWAYDPFHPSPDVLVFLDRRLIGFATANIERPGLSYINGTGKHGFEVRPVNLGQKAKSIEVYVADAPFSFETQLEWFGEDKVKKPGFHRRLPWVGSGKDKVTPPEPVAFGFVERADAGWVTGWVFDPAVPEAASVRLMINGVDMSSTQASVARPALAEIFGRDPSFGFGFELPVTDMGVATQADLDVVVVDTKTGVERPLTFLEGVPRRIELPAANIQGEIEVFTDEAISGWVYDPQMETTGAQVILLGPNGDELATALANIDRSDLAWVNGSGNKLGFTIVPEKIGVAGDVAVRLVVKDRPTGDLVDIPTPGPLAVSQPVAQGALEMTDCDSLYGWAYDPRLGASPVVVEILIDGQSLGKTFADLPRPGLTWLEGSDHGFGFWMPDVLTAGTHDVAIAYTDQRTGLQVMLPKLEGVGQITCEVKEFPPLVCE